ncbi:hypothetical protein BDA99DRAFT_534670 [Phascolomyces articulosus]|uniref:Uncharacterized protein n=1 Tax=Phascolomyces articulosus TaxID=60185 RepID=A0AAD5K5L7_9FUNG|nr:hypothetical protein BDA99DRAFT_534670 [Phascolomyces articulosus]
MYMGCLTPKIKIIVPTLMIKTYKIRRVILHFTTKLQTIYQLKSHSTLQHEFQNNNIDDDHELICLNNKHSTAKESICNYDKSDSEHDKYYDDDDARRFLGFGGFHRDIDGDCYNVNNEDVIMDLKQDIVM